MTRHGYGRRAVLTSAASAALLIAVIACGSRPAPGNTVQVGAAAWAEFAQPNNWGSTALPTDTTTQLGLLTLPAGPADAPGAGNFAHSNGEAYTALNQLAWGFSSKQCGPVLPPA